MFLQDSSISQGGAPKSGDEERMNVVNWQPNNTHTTIRPPTQNYFTFF